MARPVTRTRRLLLALTASLLSMVGCADPPPAAGNLAGWVRQIPTPGSHTRNTIEYRLRLKHLHTGESIDVAYRDGAKPISSGIRMLNHFLRDWRTNEDANYPVEEFDLLHSLMGRLHRSGGLIEIICGYRSPQTNRLLRAGTPRSGVAESSQHMLSHAIDLRVPGVSTERVRDAALSLGRGGVGYYPQSGFVHVDVGPVRQWSFGQSLVAGLRHSRTHRSYRRG